MESFKNDIAHSQWYLTATLELAAKLAESRSSQPSKWKAHRKCSAEELVAIRDTRKVLNDDDGLSSSKPLSRSLTQGQRNTVVSA